MTLFDEKSEELRESFEKLLDFLEQQGVPNKVCSNLNEEFPTARQVSLVKPSKPKQDFFVFKLILKTCLELSKCYLYMNVLDLLENIRHIWEDILSYYKAGRDQIKKRLQKIKQKDQVVIQGLKLLQEEYDECICLSNIESVRIRTLMQLHHTESAEVESNE